MTHDLPVQIDYPSTLLSSVGKVSPPCLTDRVLRDGEGQD